MIQESGGFEDVVRRPEHNLSIQAERYNTLCAKSSLRRQILFVKIEVSSMCQPFVSSHLHSGLHCRFKGWLLGARERNCCCLGT